MALTGSRILLIEDNAPLADNMIEILELEGSEVVHVTTGAHAREAARAPFDVALVDVKLPDSTGLELLRELKHGDDLREVLLVTGNASIEDAVEAVKGGAYDYIIKPFQVDELLSSVERACRQVRASRAARNLSEEVMHREQKLRTLVDTVQALLLVLDSQGRVLQSNSAVTKVTGLLPEDLEGMVWIDTFVPKSERDEVLRVFSRILAGESRVSHENGVTDVNGRHARIVRWNSSALVLPDGDLVVYASGLDITDVKELEQRTRLAERLAAVGTLSAGLAHEIRNPLNSAQLQLRLLDRRLRKVSEDPKLLEPIQLVQGEILRLSDLVREFLDFARPSDLRLAEIELGVVVRDVLELERHTADERAVSIELRHVDQVSVFADRDKVKQVMLNLLRNAVEAVEDYGAVFIDIERIGTGGLVRIRDTGPGMSADVLARIFEPFFSTKPSGTGLGMAICHSLIAQHGGNIRVFSAQSGATVEIILPSDPLH
jgi:PAS domain S-box-containing protein